MKTDEDGRREAIHNAAAAAAGDWVLRQSMQLRTEMYIWYKPGHIAFWCGTDALNGSWQLADPQRIPTSWTAPALTHHIADLARRLPILPANGDAPDPTASNRSLAADLHWAEAERLTLEIWRQLDEVTAMRRASFTYSNASDDGLRAKDLACQAEDDLRKLEERALTERISARTLTPADDWAAKLSTAYRSSGGGAGRRTYRCPQCDQVQSRITASVPPFCSTCGTSPLYAMTRGRGRTAVDVTGYRACHGRLPVGHGTWVFTMKLAGARIAGEDGRSLTERSVWVNGAFWVTGPYGEAARQAIYEARMLGANCVEVEA